MDREVGFGNHHHPADPLRLKLMEIGTDHRRARFPGRIQKNLLYLAGVGQDARVAIVEFHRHMAAERESGLTGVFLSFTAVHFLRRP